MKTITLEEHFVTMSFLEATGTYGKDAPEGLREMRAKLLDLNEDRIDAMDEGGIDMQVLSLAAIGIEALDASVATPLLRDVNDELAEAVRDYPKRFAGFAALALKEPENAAKELERCVTTLGFKGALLDGTTDGQFLDAPRFLPVFEAANALGVPIYLHPAPPPKVVQEAYYSGLPGEIGHLLSIAGWGWHAETGLHVLRLIAAGVLDRFPDLQIIIGHMGEGLPYALARSSGVLSRELKHLPLSVAQYFHRNFHVTTSGYFTRPPFACALEVVGIDRLLYSVDYPFSPNTKGRDFLNSLDLTDDAMAKLTHGNAEALLRLHI
jgi:predicted TIM-barrel fold metal-dependent hydrolase